MSTAQATPMNVMQAMSQGLGQLLPVINLHWAGFTEERPFQTTLNTGMRTFYRWAGVPNAKAKPTIWVVTDGLVQTYLGEKRYGKTFDSTTAPKIAADMVRCGSGGDVGDASTILPAVWIAEAPDCPKNVIGELVLPDNWESLYPLFAAEVALYRQREWQWCQMQVDIADGLHAKGATAEIYDKHRKSATWIDANPADHLWINPISLGDKKQCPFCATTIPAAAVKCPNQACGEVLDRKRYDAIKAGVNLVEPAPASNSEPRGVPFQKKVPAERTA